MDPSYWVFSIIVYLVSTLGLGFFVKGWFVRVEKKIDDSVPENICKERRERFEKKVDQFCEKNAGDHKEFYRRFEEIKISGKES